MKQFIYLFLLVAPMCAKANISTISGTVIDAGTKLPLGGAMVFIDRSMEFSLSDSAGHFSFADTLPPVTELVVTLPGYETLNYPLTSRKPVLTIRFEMIKKGLEKPGSKYENRPEYQQLFLSHFLGFTPNANNAVLSNPGALRFSFDSSSNILSASAHETLTILNDALGYMVFYKLDSFWVNVSTNISDFSGYCLFRNLSTDNDLLKRRWNIRRNEVYQGSMLHFMRVCSANTPDQQGFQLKKIISFLEDDKGFKKALQSDKVVRSGTIAINNEYKKFVDVPDEKTLNMSQVRSLDTIAKNVTLFLDEPLLVEWKNENKNQQPINGFSGTVPPITLISFSDKVLISPSGAYVSKNNLFVQGFMKEKVADLLPLEYIAD